MNLLVFIEGINKGQRYFIDKKVTSIGRAPENDLIVDDEGVSRNHARIIVDGSEVSLLDLDSTNGTYVNNKKISSEILLNGDRVIIGDSIVMFKSKESSVQTTSITFAEVDKYDMPSTTTIQESDDSFIEKELELADKTSKNFHALYDFMVQLSSLTFVDKLLATMFEMLDKYLPVDRTVVFLVDGNSELKVAGSHMGDKKGVGLGITVSKSLLTQVMETGKSILSINPGQEIKPVGKSTTQLKDVKSIMCSPLKVQDKIIGVIYCESLSDKEDFNQEQLQLLTAFAIEAGISIENARLYEQLMNSFEYNQCVLKNIGSGILVIDNNGEITNVNESGCEILGIPHQNVIGKSIYSYENLGDFTEALRETISSGIPRERMEVVIKRPDNKDDVPLGISTSILENYEGENVGVICSFRDLTNIKKLQEEVRRGQQLAALGEMSAGVAHEIRNPLNSIRGFVQLLQEKYSDQEETYTNIIISEVDRLDAIIQELLDFSRDKKPVMEDEISVNNLIKDISVKQAPTALDAQIRIKTDLMDNLPLILCNYEKLTQVMLNIVQNAFQATNPGGTVLLKTYLANKEKDIFSYVVIEIIDNGSGMDQDTLNRIFEPFFTSKERGTGLGLAITKKIIEQHRGQIEVDSIVDKGTTFRILLPAKK